MFSFDFGKLGIGRALFEAISMLNLGTVVSGKLLSKTSDRNLLLFLHYLA
jgi:hypothetical protein